MKPLDVEVSRTWADLFQLAGAKSITIRSTGTVCALCVFHPEKTPSMFGWPGRGFYCFGCQAAGGPEDFARAVLGMQQRHLPGACWRLELPEDAQRVAGWLCQPVWIPPLPNEPLLPWSPDAPG